MTSPWRATRSSEARRARPKSTTALTRTRSTQRDRHRPCSERVQIILAIIVSTSAANRITSTRSPATRDQVLRSSTSSPKADPPRSSFLTTWCRPASVPDSRLSFRRQAVETRPTRAIFASMLSAWSLVGSLASAPPGRIALSLVPRRIGPKGCGSVYARPVNPALALHGVARIHRPVSRHRAGLLNTPPLPPVPCRRRGPQQLRFPVVPGFAADVGGSVALLCWRPRSPLSCGPWFRGRCRWFGCLSLLVAAIASFL